MTKAVVLAAGRGTRMQALTADLPKPMLPLKGRPILDYVHERLARAGFREFAFVVGYRRDVIEQHFAGRGVQFFVQDRVEGTAKATLLARDFVGASPFLLTFGDILVEAGDYAEMAAMLDRDRDALAVGAVRWVEDPWQGAAVYEQGGVIRRIIEKPEKGTSKTNWNSAGIYCFRAEVFEELTRIEKSPRGEYELTSAVERLVERGKVLMHPIRGTWRDIGRPEDWEAAQTEV